MGKVTAAAHVDLTPLPASAPIAGFTVVGGASDPVSLLRIKGAAKDPQIVFRLDLTRDEALALAEELRLRAG